jgi:4-hydroxybenzoate polyprenyltransferase
MTAPAPPSGTPSWINRHMPASVGPYLRLARVHQPIGVWLLFWPGAWSLAMAGEGKPDLGLLALFAIGAMAMRAAGCVINDMADRKIDAQVARTADRPLASGEIGLLGAALFLAVLLALGAGILVTFNSFAICLGAGSLVLVAAYPFAKRITWWPQAFLGLTFNWGALLGWAAATGGLGWPAGLLYLGAIFWTIGYDTIYAHQDKEDDLLVGVKSSALALGKNTLSALAVFYGLSLAFLAGAGALAGLHWPWYLGLGLVALAFAWQILFVHLDDPADCLAKFKSNAWIGWIVFVALLLSALVG